jgi:hypothetical protein
MVWTTYAIERALWHGDKFKKEFPNEPKDRRTMREEADCLHWMVTVLTEDKDFEKKKKDVDPSRLQLVAIDQAGFIEAFALLNRADNEIAQDLRHLPHRQPRQDFPLLRRVRGPEKRHNRPHPSNHFPRSSQTPSPRSFYIRVAKITLPKPFRLSFRPEYTYNVFRYQALSSSTSGPSLAPDLY